MTDIRRPRRGSLAVRPRKRARTLLYKFNYWLGDKDILGFIGYKVGMVSINYKTVLNKAPISEITTGTVIEVPPIVVYGIRYYYKNNKTQDILTNNLELLKPLGVKKLKQNSTISLVDIKDVRLLVYSLPTETGGVEINHPLRAEIGLGGSINKKIETANKYLGRKVSFSEIFKVGDVVDVGGVTKGKGWQGEIKRFGIAKQRRKATGKVRHVGTLGPWHPHYVMYYVPRAGQTGYHNRVELNKQILYIGKESLNKFDHYGLVKNEYVIVHGSVPGSVKRPISLRLAVRAKEPKEIKDVKVVL